MRLSSVVFPAPRKPVRIVIGTALPLSVDDFHVQVPIQNVLADRAPRRDARRDTGPTPLFLEFTQINFHHLRQLDEIDLLRVLELSELFTLNVRRIVLLRINLKVARQLLLLFLARHPGLRDDANARSERQRIAEQESGVRKWLARESRQRGLRCQIASLVTLTTTTSGAPYRKSPSQWARTPALISLRLSLSNSRWVSIAQRGLTCLKR